MEIFGLNFTKSCIFYLSFELVIIVLLTLYLKPIPTSCFTYLTYNGANPYILTSCILFYTTLISSQPNVYTNMFWFLLFFMLNSFFFVLLA